MARSSSTASWIRSAALQSRRRWSRWPGARARTTTDLAMHALDTGLVPQRTHMQVTTSIETLLGLGGSPAAEMEFSLPISAKAVERLACDCSVTRILLGSDSTVIDVGRAKRV